MESTVGELQIQNLELKISRKHILELSDENVIEGNDEVNILHINNCENLTEAQEKILNLNFEKFPNIFVIAFKLLNEIKEKTEDFLGIILNKFSDKNRPLIVELSSKKVTKFYYKQRNEKRFSSLPQKFPEKMLKMKLDKFGLTCDCLLLIMKSSLLDADFSIVLEHFKGSKIHPIMQAVDKGDELSFHILNLFDLNLSEEFKDKILLHTIEFKKFDLLLAFFNAFDESQVTQQHINKILSLNCDEKSQNSFMLVVETKNLKLTKLLLSFSTEFPQFFTFKLFEEALKAIKKREFFEVFDDLCNAEFNLTPEEEKLKKTLMCECEKILNEISQLKKSIKDKKLFKFKEFAQKYPELRLCSGKSEVCALELSINNKNFSTYALLKSLGFYTDKGEDFDRKIQNLTNEEKKKIRDENLKHFVRNPDVFNGTIGIILSKCTFEPQSPIASSDVREMLLDLNNFDEISSMYPTVAHANVQINFDFKNKTVHVMDPVHVGSVLGLAYHDMGIIYVGLNNSKNQRYGTFAHELMHLVLHLIFENDCLPYCKGDTEREAEFKKIVDDLSEYCKKNPNTEPIIKRVFYYNPNKWYKEMAVCVNEMLAFYHDNQAKIEELQGLFHELFSYIRNKVLPDLKIPNVYRMIKINNDFGLLEKIKRLPIQATDIDCKFIESFLKDNKKVIFTSNIPQTVLHEVVKIIDNMPGNKLNLKLQNLFIDTSKINLLTLEGLKEFKSIKRIIVLIKEFKSNIFKVLNEFDEKICVYFIFEGTLPKRLLKLPDDYERFDKIVQWKDLTEEAKQVILNRNVNFQGKNFQVNEILPNYTDVSDEILPILCSYDEVKINCVEVSHQKKFMIQRKITITHDNNSSKVCELEDFLFKHTANDQIVIISNISGEGKTFLLHEINQILIDEFPLHWISYIDLKCHIKDLEELVKNSKSIDFKAIMRKILKLDGLSFKIFCEKFNQGEVVLLFDALNEISHQLMLTALKLFKEFKTTKPNKMFIAIQPRFEHELKFNFDISFCKIVSVTEEEQIEYFMDVWREQNENKQIIEKCATSLVKVFSKILSDTPELVGIPLIMQRLAKAYKNNLKKDEFGDENSVKINFDTKMKDLNFETLFKKIFETNLGSDAKEACQSLAFFQNFGQHLNSNYSEILKLCEIVSLDKYEQFQFKHETYADSLFAELLQTFNNIPENSQTDFLITILTDVKFKITRFFLEILLKNPEKFTIAIEDLIHNTKTEGIIKNASFEGHVNIFLIVLRKLKKGDFSFYLNMLNAKGEGDKKTVLSEILCNAKTEEKIQNILLELCCDDPVSLNFFSSEENPELGNLLTTIVSVGHKKNLDDLLRYKVKDLLTIKSSSGMNLLSSAVAFNPNVEAVEFLWEYFEMNVVDFKSKFITDDTDNEGQNIFHIASAFCKSSEIFKFLWLKIEKLLEDKESIKKFLLQKDNSNEIALLKSIKEKNLTNFSFSFKEIYCKYLKFSEFAYTEQNEQCPVFFEYFAQLKFK